VSLKDRIIQTAARQPGLLDQEIAFDIVFIMHVSARGWILEKICREIAEASGLTYSFVYSERNDSITAPIPRARAYFFAHYAIYAFALAAHPELHGASLFVWFTHPDFGKGIGLDDLVYALQQADLIFTANAQHAAALAVMGIPRAGIRTIYGGADPAHFRGKPRGNGKVAFVGAYYERKRPEQMIALIRAMPDVPFLLLGPSADSVQNQELLWSNYTRYAELRTLSNLEIIETEYEDYPRHFAGIDVFASLSALEGGPIALIEAMMANAVPVVTRTGFAEELVRHGQNGFLVSLDAEIAEIVPLVRQALTFERDVAQGAEAWSWAAFGAGISREMRFPVKGKFEMSFGRQDSAARRYLREGWDVPENLGAWQFAPRATLLLPLREGQSLQNLALQLQTGTDFESESISLRLLLNDHLLATTELKVGHRCELALSNLPAEALQLVNRLSIEVLTPPTLLIGDVPRLLRLNRIGGETQPISDRPRLRRAGGAVLAQHQEAEEDASATDFLFMASEPGTELPAYGWNEAENNGTWSNQAEASVIIPVAPSLKGKLRVVVSGRVYEPFRTRNTSLAITLSDGRTDATGEFKVPDGEPQDFVMDYENRSGRRMIQLRIALNSIASPSELGIDAADHRRLGFMLSSITLNAAP
jgi:glycosyltransferase involved in cell wall biosynthesis